jgi:hypothetical protein
MDDINDNFNKKYLKYKNKYFKLKKQTGGLKPRDKIIISLTTINSRIKKIKCVLDSICQQEMQADEIFVFISQDPYLLDTGFDEHDSYILHLKLLYPNINFCFVKNIGSFRKLIPILDILNKRQQQAFIITIDDDCIYESQMINKLYTAAIKNELCISCGRGRSINIATTDFENTNIMKFPLISEESQSDFMNVLPEGVGSICYHSSMFDGYTFDIDKLSDFERKNDDIVFRKITFHKNIPVKVINIKYNDMGPKIGLFNYYNCKI